MRLKKITVMILAFIMVLSMATTAFAAPYDFTHKTDDAKQYSLLDVASTSSVLLDIVSNQNSYLIEGDDGSKYVFNEVKALIDSGMTFNEAIAELDPVEEDLQVEEVSAIDDINVEFGGEVVLPEVATIVLSDESEVEVPVTWEGDYDVEVAGTYELVGTLDLSALENVAATELTASVNVVVAEDPAVVAVEEATAAVETAESEMTQEAVDTAQALVTALPEDAEGVTTKADLQARLDAVQAEVDAAAALEAAEEAVAAYEAATIETYDDVAAAEELKVAAEEAVAEVAEGEDFTARITAKADAIDAQLAGVVAAVNDAANDPALLNALQGFFNEVDSTFITQYVANLGGANVNTTVDQIQDTIYEVLVIQSVAATQASQIELLEALNKGVELGLLTDVNPDLIAAYEVAIDGSETTIALIQADIDGAVTGVVATATAGVVTAEGTINQTNIDNAQASIDAIPEGTVDANDELVKPALQARLDAVQLVLDVHDADAVNQIELLAVLEANFERVNSAWIGDYSLALTGTGTESTVALIQTDIDTVNEIKADAALTGLATEPTRAEYDEAVTLVNTWVKPDVDPVTTKADYLTDLAEVEAVISVNEATTEAELTAALDKLEATDDAAPTASPVDDFDIDTVNPVIMDEYLADITAAAAGAKDIVAEIQGLVVTANTNAEQDAVDAVAAITAETTTDELKTLLTTLDNRSSFVAGAFDLDTVNDALLEDYRAAIVAETSGNNKDEASEIQGFITAANSPVAALNAIDLEVKTPSDATGETLLGLLQAASLEFDNLVEANAAEYLADATDFDAAITDTTAVAGEEDNVALVIDATNARVALNEATTVTEANAALLDFAIAYGNTTFINVSGTHKSEIAELVLADIEANGAYATNALLDTAIGVQDGIRTGLINPVNAAGPDNTNTISAMDSALEGLGYEAYDNLSAAEQIAVAEAFLNAFPMDDAATPAQVDYTTLTDIRADIDAAIAAQ